jgi:hypothetical protein
MVDKEEDMADLLEDTVAAAVVADGDHGREKKANCNR